MQILGAQAEMTYAKQGNYKNISYELHGHFVSVCVTYLDRGSWPERFFVALFMSPIHS